MGMSTLFDLSGKTALVTGCKRGIGRGMAEALAAAGADIIGVSATLEEQRQRGRAPPSPPWAGNSAAMPSISPTAAH